MEKTRKEKLMGLQVGESLSINNEKDIQPWRTEASYTGKSTGRLYTIKTEKTATGKVTKVHRLK